MNEKNIALLIVAHGSRWEQSNEEIQRLAESIGQKQESKYALIYAAFLEIAEPTISQGLQFCANQNMNEIIVFPYFLAAGRHVMQDIPEEVNVFQQKNPQISIRIVDYFGCLSTMPQTILTMIE